MTPLEVRFPHAAPRSLKEHRAWFRCPLTFGARRCEIELHATDLERPVVSADSTLASYLDRLAKDALDRLGGDESVADRVRRTVWATLADGPPSLERTAARVGHSARTLQRRLAEDGASFERIVDDLRRELAARLLRQHRLAVYEVAFMLGYSDASQFSRAFHRWYGQTPRAYRVLEAALARPFFMRALFLLATFLERRSVPRQPIVARIAPAPRRLPCGLEHLHGVLPGRSAPGYAYAHLLERRCRPRCRPRSTWRCRTESSSSRCGSPQSSAPASRGAGPLALGTLVASIGFPFFALATTGPLLQRWFHLGTPRGRDPYFLYAAGNVGSLAALLAYPRVVEPSLALSAQTLSFSAGYVVFALLMAASAALVWKRTRATQQPEETASPGAAVPWRSRLFWVLLAFVPSSALVAVTQYLSTDLAVFPLLWVLPLAVYLTTFILAFSRRSWLPPAWWSAGLAFAAVGSWPASGSSSARTRGSSSSFIR